MRRRQEVKGIRHMGRIEVRRCARDPLPICHLPFVICLVLSSASCDNTASPPAASAELASHRIKSASAGTPWFEEIAQQAGIHFVHTSGRRDGRYLFPETVCGGAALFDMDGDGWLDIFFVQSGAALDERETPVDRSSGSEATSRLYRNRGDGTFEDVTATSGAGLTGYGIGVTTGDYDNDGDTDLYITNVGPNVLLRNEGCGRFTDVTADAGAGGDGWSSGSAFLDFDRDGDLDLFVADYMYWTADGERECRSPAGAHDYCAPRSYNAPARDTLYRNNGDGTFSDVSQLAGLHAAFGPGLGVVCADFNGDDWIDIFVANDGRVNQLWTNQGMAGEAAMPRFVDEALLMGCALDLAGIAKAGMGVDAADFDDDGDIDLVVMNFHNETDSVYRRYPSHFADETSKVGLGVTSRGFTRFGVGLIDFDNDGVLDLYEACGRVNRQEQLFSSDPYAEPNLLFRGAVDGRFVEVQPRGGALPMLVGVSRAAVFGDIDNDGGVDVLVVNRDAAPHLLHNIAADSEAWIMLRVLNEHGSDAIGAKVVCTVGARRVTRTVRTAYSYCAANDPRVHIGLGAARRVDRVEVMWPDGSVEQFGPFDAGQIVTITRGDGEEMLAR
jgi:hypothetical protein